MMKLTYTIKEVRSIYQFLMKQNYSKKLVKAIKYQGGKILVNGNVEYIEKELKFNDLLEVNLPQELISDHFKAYPVSLDIVYEDDYLLIINKPPHLASIPSCKDNINSLANGIKFYFNEHHIVSNVHLINRLDKETSGLVMVAKNRLIHHLMSNHTTITKKYLAVVSGRFEMDKRVIEKNIIRENELKMKRIVSDLGSYARTDVLVLKRIKDVSLLECELKTGRTHQIRVHLSSINHPIIGDSLYGGKSYHRMALQCHYLQFSHPITKEVITIQLELPEDILRILK